MSGPPISQIEYWKKGDSGPSTNGDNEGGEGATYLSPNVFLALSVFGGYLGLDHLYLRSPLTAIAKVVVNVLCFGVWWLYDASQALFNSDVVRIFGLGIPGLGPQGIGAGVLGKDVPDKKHWRFFLYGLALFFGGTFGVDSFVVGDTYNGFIRLLLAISVILLPVALIWWAYKIYQFVFDTKELLNTHHEFFGAIHRSFSKESMAKYPFLSALLSPMDWIRSGVENVFGPIVKPITSSIDGVVALGNKTLDTGGKIIDGVKTVAEGVKSAINVATKSQGVVPGAALYASVTPEAIASAIAEAKPEAITEAIAKAKPETEAIAKAKSETKAIAKAKPEAITEAIAKAKPETKAIAKAKPETEAELMPDIELLPKVIQAANKIPLNEKEPGAILTGGALIVAAAANNLNPTHYLLIGTIVFIAVAGITLTYYRAKQDDKPSEHSRDDAPPEPGILRESDSKGGRA